VGNRKASAYGVEELAGSVEGDVDGAVAELAAVAAADDQPGHLERGRLDVALVQGPAVGAACQKPKKRWSASQLGGTSRGTTALD
jgi:hypothetical protein